MVYILIKLNGDWGMGIGDWGWGQSPNPQSPIPNPQSPIPIKINNIFLIKFKKKLVFILLFLIKFIKK
jgi:hypothetical protein